MINRNNFRCYNVDMVSVPSEIFIPFSIAENSSSEIIINGMFANAHPVTTVRSTFLQIIPRGATLFDLIE